MVAVGEWVFGVGAGVAAAALVGAEWLRGNRFERRRDEERARLLEGVVAPGTPAGPQPAEPRFVDAGTHGAEDSVLGDRRDEFTPILVEYYAYGLAQARSSFATSQRFAGVGAAILLFGVALAVWKAESAGDVYVGVVTSSVGLVVTLVGQLFHRRADVALRHMAAQTAALREDRRAAENTQQAIGLLDEIADPALRGRLQAGLILKLSGADLPSAAP
ncbi:hypothetical protein [Streptomyces sp. NPDC048606]|uniref:TRADD-N-associated membrane domain-containing protein n=1 Tax=Streptomyces sp. NPDC048606 TaxID=3154726 RepID=UPI003428C918